MMPKNWRNESLRGHSYGRGNLSVLFLPKGVVIPKPGFVYMMTNQACTVLYTGVTSQLLQRVWQHQHETVPGFTSKYHLHRLVFYETCDEIRGAIAREKQIKSWSRAKKEALVRSTNPTWRDLSEDMLD